MMDVRNCKRCGRVFQYKGNPVCNHCLMQEEEDFHKVRDYIADNPNSSSVDISMATGVELKTIIRFLREGRLEFEKIVDSGLTCERCGIEISSGRYCKACAAEIQADLAGASQQLGDSRGAVGSPASSAAVEERVSSNELRKESAKEAERNRPMMYTYDTILNKKK